VYPRGEPPQERDLHSEANGCQNGGEESKAAVLSQLFLRPDANEEKK